MKTAKEVAYRTVPIRLVYIDPEDDEEREEEIETKLRVYLEGGGIIINAPTVTKVGKKYRIWAGRHRYRSQRDAGLKRIQVGVVTGATENEMRILMIQENLYRKKVRDVLEQTAELLARLRQEGYGAVDGRGGDRRSANYKEKMVQNGSPVSIIAKMASELNLDRSTAQRYKAIVERAVPEIKDAYRQKRVFLDQAARLANLPPNEQVTALSALLTKQGEGPTFDRYAYSSLNRAARMLEANQGQPVTPQRLASLMHLVGKVQEALRGLRVSADGG